MFGYSRIYPRERYETVLVEALVACGYQIVLSTNHEDEQQGIDVWDTEYEIPWDLYIGETSSLRYAKKLATSASKGVAILHIPNTLVDEICLNRINPSKLRNALLTLDGIYEKSLGRAAGKTFRTRTQTQKAELSWLKAHRRQAA